MKFKKLIPVILLAFIVFLAISFFGDFKKTFSSIISFNWLLFPVILFFSFINFLLRFFRWEFLLSQINVKMKKKTSALIFFSGLAMGITPLRSGELVKSSMIKKINGAEISKTAPLMLVERLSDSIGMLILMSAGLVVFDFGKFVFFFSVFFIFIFIVIVNNEKMSKKIIVFLNKFPVLNKHEKKIYNLYSSSKIMLKYKTLLPLILLSTLAWASIVFGSSLVYFILGVKFSFLTLLSFSFIFCFSGAVGFLTAIPGGLGVSEASVAGLLVFLMHLPKEVAASGVLISRLSTLWFGTLIGIIAMILFYRNSKFETQNLEL